MGKAQRNSKVVEEAEGNKDWASTHVIVLPASSACNFKKIEYAITWDQALEKIVSVMALLGSTGIVAIMLLTILSVLGRNVLGTPILGDFELVGMLSGVSAFLFLPYCQEKYSHVQVDLLAKYLPKSISRAISGIFVITAVIMSLFFILGGAECYESGERTAVLSLPLWLPYPFCAVSFFVLGCVCCKQFMKEWQA